MSYNFKATVDNVSDSSLMWFFRVQIPDDVMTHFKKTDKRVKCSINNSSPIQIAIHSNGDGTFYLMLNKEIRKNLSLQAGDEVDVHLEKDDSKYGIYVPDFFEELCFQDPEADRLFHNLTPGKQRSLLHIIGKLKSEQKQLEKALIIFDYLKESNGNLDFKELNQAFKNSRFRN